MKEDRRRGNKGFAGMSPERQREIASMGGKAVPNEKRSFSQNRKLAQAAGQKGGRMVAPENRSFSKDRELAAAAGAKGGSAVPSESRSEPGAGCRGRPQGRGCTQESRGIARGGGV